MRTHTITLALAIVLLCPHASGQWVQTNGPYGGVIQSLAVNDTSIFAGSAHGGVCRSTDNGESWIDVRTGMNGIGVNALVVTPNGTGGTNIFAGSTGVYRSTDGGMTWSEASAGLPWGYVDGGVRYYPVFCFAVSGSDLFAGTFDGVFLSNDNGTNWTRFSPGWMVNALALSPNGTGGTILFAGTQGSGVFVSADSGNSWNPAGTGLTSSYTYSLAIAPNGTGGTNLFAGTGGGIFVLANNSTNWTGVNTGLTNSDVRALAVCPDGTGGTDLIAGTIGGIFLSTNDGASWTGVDSGLTESRILALAVRPNGTGGTDIFAGTYGSGVFRSTNRGASWLNVNDGMIDTDVMALAVSPDDLGRINLFAGTDASGVFLSTNNGTHWTPERAGLTNPQISALIEIPNGSAGKSIFAGSNGVYRSTNNGSSWTFSSAGLPGHTDETGWHYSQVMCFAVLQSGLYAGSYGVCRSTDNGASWVNVSSNLTNLSVGSLAAIQDNTEGGSLFKGGPGGVFVSSDIGSSWSEIGPAGADVRSFALSSGGPGGVILYAGTEGSFSGVFRFTNNGTTWNFVPAGLAGQFVTSLVVSPLAGGGAKLFAGTYGGVFLSENGGTNWNAVNDGLTTTSVHALVATDSLLFVGTDAGVWSRPLSEMVASVNQSSADLPTHFSVAQNYPNPFNPSTTIKYELPKSSHVSLTVYDLLGRQVSALVNERRDAGVHEVKYDGSNLASGVYFYRLQAGDFTQTKRLLLLK